jgi:hypothetical protein
MNSSFRNSGLVFLCLALCLSAGASTATFQIIEDPIIGTWSNLALSGSGEVMAANCGGEIFLWTASSGFQDLGPLGDPKSGCVAFIRAATRSISSRPRNTPRFAY